MRDEALKLLKGLWGLLSEPGWAEVRALRDMVHLTADLLLKLQSMNAPRAQRDARFLARALQRIGRGRWPTSREARLFLADCVRAVTLHLGFEPFWSEKQYEELKQATSKVHAQEAESALQEAVAERPAVEEEVPQAAPPALEPEIESKVQLKEAQRPEAREAEEKPQEPRRKKPVSAPREVQVQQTVFSPQSTDTEELLIVLSDDSELNKEGL